MFLCVQNESDRTQNLQFRATTRLIHLASEIEFINCTSFGVAPASV